MRIIQINMFDIHGGAERVAWDLAAAYRARGHDALLAVGRKRSDDPGVFCIPNHRARAIWPRLWWTVHHRLQPCYPRSAAVRALCRMAHRLAEPEGLLATLRGVEDFNYPGTWRLLDATPGRPDVIHCHNLHQKYFDLRALPWLSREAPVILTLHDAWLLSGHCAHSFDCERWRTGCGQCPDLTIHPAIRRDATAANWLRKRSIYQASRLHVATPCQWLMDRVRQSNLAAGVVDARIIPYGIDLDIFRPGDRSTARAAVGLPTDAAILLFAASGIRRNIWKDYQTMRLAVDRLGRQERERPLFFIALGEDSPPEKAGRGEIRFVPFQSDPRQVARYYQAADVYVHAARVDTFPNTVLEALACGVPVVATAVGGIPEQVRSLRAVNGSSTGHPPDEATGILTPPGDAAAMADALEHLLADEPLRRRLGENAAEDARRRLDLDREADAYLTWYAELLATSRRETA